MQDIKEFASFVVDNIGSVNMANALKLVQNIDLKGTGDGYNVNDFIIAFSTECSKRARSTYDHNYNTLHSNMSMITLKSLKEITRKTANKQMVFDMWLFNILDLFGVGIDE